MLQLTEHGGTIRYFKSLINEFTSILPHTTATRAYFLLFDLCNIISKLHTTTSVLVKI